MKLYAVSLVDIAGYDSNQYWIEFYEADDSDHAEEQAKDANPDADILAVAWVRE